MPPTPLPPFIGDGAFMMTCMELATAARLGVGGVFTIFNDGELAQISQAQQVPYNRKTCTTLGDTRFRGVAEATGVEYLRLENNDGIDGVLEQALSLAENGRPVILDVQVDYSKKTRFTRGIVATNLERMPLGAKTRMISRALWRWIAAGKQSH